MATPKKLKEYPLYYRALFIEALSIPVAIRCTCRSEAVAYRGRLYAFQSAIRNDLDFDPVLSLIEPVIMLRIDANRLMITSKEKLNDTNR